MGAPTPISHPPACGLPRNRYPTLNSKEDNQFLGRPEANNKKELNWKLGGNEEAMALRCASAATREASSVCLSGTSDLELALHNQTYLVALFTIKEKS